MQLSVELGIWIAAAVFALALDILVAREFYLAASMKGWTSKKYFFYAMFLPVLGYLLVIALPDRGSAEYSSVRLRDLPKL